MCLPRLRFWLAPLLLIAAAAYFLIYWPMRDPHPAPLRSTGVLALQDMKIYPSPDAPPIEHGSVIVARGIITAVGPNLPIPAHSTVLSCPHCVVMAGFWNAHVHFTEPKWDFAAFKSAATLNAQLADMITSRGFTTVVDAGSAPRLTLSLRRRIEHGELSGPKIYTAGTALYPPHGVPYYVKNSLPFYLLWFIPQPSTPTEAAGIEAHNIDRGADLLKLFTGSYVARGKVEPMPLAIAAAAVHVAHQHGQLTYSHPSNLAGTRVAIDSGVDVLAHAPDSTRGVDSSILDALVAHHMAMVPTLKMFATTVTTDPAYLDPIYAEVRGFHARAGQLLFGTDVGYMTDYTTEGEFQGLAKSGLSARDMLRMLTTAPAQRFGVANRKGVIAPNYLGDLVVLDGDPFNDIAAFSRVRWTIRSGRAIYARR